MKAWIADIRRQLERRKLVAELDRFKAQQEYMQERGPVIWARLQTLAREDLAYSVKRWPEAAAALGIGVPDQDRAHVEEVTP